MYPQYWQCEYGAITKSDDSFDLLLNIYSSIGFADAKFLFANNSLLLEINLFQNTANLDNLSERSSVSANISGPIFYFESEISGIPSGVEVFIGLKQSNHQPNLFLCNSKGSMTSFQFNPTNSENICSVGHDRTDFPSSNLFHLSKSKIILGCGVELHPFKKSEGQSFYNCFYTIDGSFIGTFPTSLNILDVDLNGNSDLSNFHVTPCIGFHHLPAESSMVNIKGNFGQRPFLYMNHENFVANLSCDTKLTPLTAVNKSQFDCPPAIIIERQLSSSSCASTVVMGRATENPVSDMLWAVEALKELLLEEQNDATSVIYDDITPRTPMDGGSVLFVSESRRSPMIDRSSSPPKILSALNLPGPYDAADAVKTSSTSSQPQSFLALAVAGLRKLLPFTAAPRNDNKPVTSVSPGRSQSDDNPSGNSRITLTVAPKPKKTSYDYVRPDSATPGMEDSIRSTDINISTPRPVETSPSPALIHHNRNEEGSTWVRVVTRVKKFLNKRKRKAKSAAKVKFKDADVNSSSFSVQIDEKRRHDVMQSTLSPFDDFDGDDADSTCSLRPSMSGRMSEDEITSRRQTIMDLYHLLSASVPAVKRLMLTSEDIYNKESLQDLVDLVSELMSNIEGIMPLGMPMSPKLVIDIPSAKKATSSMDSTSDGLDSAVPHDESPAKMFYDPSAECSVTKIVGLLCKLRNSRLEDVTNALDALCTFCFDSSVDQTIRPKFWLNLPELDTMRSSQSPKHFNQTLAVTNILTAGGLSTLAEVFRSWNKDSGSAVAGPENLSMQVEIRCAIVLLSLVVESNDADNFLRFSMEILNASMLLLNHFPVTIEQIKLNVKAESSNDPMKLWVFNYSWNIIRCLCAYSLLQFIIILISSAQINVACQQFFGMLGQSQSANSQASQSTSKKVNIHDPRLSVARRTSGTFSGPQSLSSSRPNPIAVLEAVIAVVEVIAHNKPHLHIKRRSESLSDMPPLIQSLSRMNSQSSLGTEEMDLALIKDDASMIASICLQNLVSTELGRTVAIRRNVVPIVLDWLSIAVSNRISGLVLSCLSTMSALIMTTSFRLASSSRLRPSISSEGEEDATNKELYESLLMVGVIEGGVSINECFKSWPYAQLKSSGFLDLLESSVMIDDTRIHSAVAECIFSLCQQNSPDLIAHGMVETIVYLVKKSHHCEGSRTLPQSPKEFFFAYSIGLPAIASLYSIVRKFAEQEIKYSDNSETFQVSMSDLSGLSQNCYNESLSFLLDTNLLETLGSLLTNLKFGPVKLFVAEIVYLMTEISVCREAICNCSLVASIISHLRRIDTSAMRGVSLGNDAAHSSLSGFCRQDLTKLLRMEESLRCLSGFANICTSSELTRDSVLRKGALELIFRIIRDSDGTHFAEIRCDMFFQAVRCLACFSSALVQNEGIMDSKLSESLLIDGESVDVAHSRKTDKLNIPVPLHYKAQLLRTFSYGLSIEDLPVQIECMRGLISLAGDENFKFGVVSGPLCEIARIAADSVCDVSLRTFAESVLTELGFVDGIRDLELCRNDFRVLRDWFFMEQSLLSQDLGFHILSKQNMWMWKAADGQKSARGRHVRNHSSDSASDLSVDSDTEAKLVDLNQLGQIRNKRSLSPPNLRRNQSNTVPNDRKVKLVRNETMDVSVITSQPTASRHVRPVSCITIRSNLPGFGNAFGRDNNFPEILPGNIEHGMYEQFVYYYYVWMMLRDSSNGANDNQSVYPPIPCISLPDAGLGYFDQKLEASKLLPFGEIMKHFNKILFGPSEAPGIERTYDEILPGYLRSEAICRWFETMAKAEKHASKSSYNFLMSEHSGSKVQEMLNFYYPSILEQYCISGRLTLQGSTDATCLAPLCISNNAAHVRAACGIPWIVHLRRSIAMPPRRYFSFRMEGKYIEKIISRNIDTYSQNIVHCSRKLEPKTSRRDRRVGFLEMSGSDSDSNNDSSDEGTAMNACWALNFRGSEFEGDFHTGLLQFLRKCPQIQSLVFSCANPESGVNMGHLIGTLPSSINHLTLENCLSRDSLQTLCVILRTKNSSFVNSRKSSLQSLEEFRRNKILQRKARQKNQLSFGSKSRKSGINKNQNADQNIVSENGDDATPAETLLKPNLFVDTEANPASIELRSVPKKAKRFRSNVCSSGLQGLCIKKHRNLLLQDACYVSELLEVAAISKSDYDRLSSSPHKCSINFDSLPFGLRYIDLSDNRLGDDGCSRILSVCARCPNLVGIDLSSNSIGRGLESNRSLRDLIASPCSHLRVLRLSHNDIQGSTMVHVLESACYNRALIDLDMSYNSIGQCQRLPDTFREFLKHNKTMRLMNLTDNKIDDEVCKLIHLGVLENSSILQIQLDRNSILTKIQEIERIHQHLLENRQQYFTELSNSTSNLVESPRNADIRSALGKMFGYGDDAGVVAHDNLTPVGHSVLTHQVSWGTPITSVDAIPEATISQQGSPGVTVTQAVFVSSTSPGQLSAYSEQNVPNLTEVDAEIERERHNMLFVMFSVPLACRSKSNEFVAIDMLDYTNERDMIWQAFQEASKDVHVRFSCATVDRLKSVLTLGCRALHFSGHGDVGKLYFENGRGGLHSIRSDGLRDIMKTHATQQRLEVVFVSACYSKEIGEVFVAAGVKHVVCVRIDDRLDDVASIEFAHAFYLSLAAGNTVSNAFNAGKCSVDYCSRITNSAAESEKFLLLPSDSDHNEVIFRSNSVRSYPTTTLINWPGMNLEEAKRRENAIPRPAEDFIGRELDMYFIIQLLAQNMRLVSIVGSSGMGKSSLAAAVGIYEGERCENNESVVFLSLKGKFAYREVIEMLFHSIKDAILHRLDAWKPIDPTPPHSFSAESPSPNFFLGSPPAARFRKRQESIPEDSVDKNNNSERLSFASDCVVEQDTDSTNNRSDGAAASFRPISTPLSNHMLPSSFFSGQSYEDVFRHIDQDEKKIDSSAIENSIIFFASHGNILLILDHIDDIVSVSETEIKMLLARMLDFSRKTRIVITCIQPLRLNFLGIVEHSHSVRPLTLGNSLSLFARLCPHLQTAQSKRNFMHSLSTEHIRNMRIDMQGLTPLALDILQLFQNGHSGRIIKMACEIEEAKLEVMFNDLKERVRSSQEL